MSAGIEGENERIDRVHKHEVKWIKMNINANCNTGSEWANALAGGRFPLSVATFDCFHQLFFTHFPSFFVGVPSFCCCTNRNNQMHAHLPCLGVKWKLNIFLPALGRHLHTHTHTHRSHIPVSKEPTHAHPVVYATKAESCVYAAWTPDYIFVAPLMCYSVAAPVQHELKLNLRMEGEDDAKCQSV